jgi:hypothetical protein
VIVARMTQAAAPRAQSSNEFWRTMIGQLPAAPNAWLENAALSELA